ncbi:unnamed protein product [Diamesa serratosioi]
MLRLSLKRFSFILFFQMSFLMFDLVLNSVGFMFIKDRKSITFMYFLQDVFLILSLASLIYSCYSTYCYQSGLTSIINKRFRVPVLITSVYILLSVILHVFILLNDQTTSMYDWPKAVTALLIVQRLCCPLNFYVFKRAALLISDPRYYENFEWINEQLNVK